MSNTTFKHNDKVIFQSREISTALGRSYLFAHYTGVVNCATNGIVDVTANDGTFFRFTKRKNGNFVPQGQSQDPKERNTLEHDPEVA